MLTGHQESLRVAGKLVRRIERKECIVAQVCGDLGATESMTGGRMVSYKAIVFWTYPEGDYSINDLAAGYTNSGMAGAKESEVAALSQLLAFGDGILHTTDLLSRFSYVRFRSHSGRPDDMMDLGQARRDQASRHNGRFNVAFADGHVQSMKTNQLFGPSEAPLRLWNRDNLPKQRSDAFDPNESDWSPPDITIPWP